MQCGQYEKLVNDSTLLQPDLTYQYKNSDEMKGCYKDYIENNGVYPINEKRKWETKEQLNNLTDLVEDHNELLPDKFMDVLKPLTENLVISPQENSLKARFIVLAAKPEMCHE